MRHGHEGKKEDTTRQHQPHDLLHRKGWTRENGRVAAADHCDRADAYDEIRRLVRPGAEDRAERAARVEARGRAQTDQKAAPLPGVAGASRARHAGLRRRRKGRTVARREPPPADPGDRRDHGNRSRWSLALRKRVDGRLPLTPVAGVHVFRRQQRTAGKCQERDNSNRSAESGSCQPGDYAALGGR